MTGINQFRDTFASSPDDDLPRRFNDPNGFKPMIYKYYDFSEGSNNSKMREEVKQTNGTSIMYECEELVDQ